jgi:hypothetical protein
MMHDDTPIRIFVAATDSEWLPMRVLEYSIIETASAAVALMPLHRAGRPIPMPRARANRPRTPFTFQRFLIPELCGYRGRAIYLDSDMLVFSDIRALWETPLHGCDLQSVQEGPDGRRPQFSVMLMDCGRLGWNVEEICESLDRGSLTYEQLMYEMKATGRIGRAIASDWNSLEHFEPGRTCLLHYTDMNRQPWVATANPLAYLWVACLRRAVRAGFVSLPEIERQVASGHVRPSLLLQMHCGTDDPRQLSVRDLQIDRRFVAPHWRLAPGHRKFLGFQRAAGRALLRRLQAWSPLARWRA